MPAPSKPPRPPSRVSTPARSLRWPGVVTSPPTAAKLLLRTKELLLLAMGTVLGQWRESRDPVSGAFAEHCQAEIQRDEYRDAFNIVSGRQRRMAPAHRNPYSPEERLAIVVHVRTWQLTNQEAAERFNVDPQTIAR